MVSSESSFQHGRVARNRALRRCQSTSVHACNHECQCTRTQLAHLPHSPDLRRDNASPATVERPVAHVHKASKLPPKCAIHCMPPEILGIVFENCLDEQVPSCAVLSVAPLLFGHVCRYWHSVSQSTHRLWTSLSLRFLETNADRSRDGVKVSTAVETWLQRSYPAPLSIYFTDNRIFQKDTEDVVIWLLSRIRMDAPRWKAIYLKFSSDYFIQLAALSSCTFTSLISFSVHVDHMGWRRGLLSLRMDLAQATQLTSLAYTGPDHVIREDILVDWARLTFIAFSYELHEAGGQTATLPRHFSTLALCRNLTELSIGLSTALAQHLHPLDVMAQGQMVFPMIELPKLRTLRVRRLSRSAHACALIDALCLPELSTLDIDSAALVGWDGSPTPLSHPDSAPTPLHMQMYTQTHWWHAHHFSALLDRSACHLRTLQIRDVDISPSELARLLTSPNISRTLSTFTFEPFPRSCPISDVLTHLISVPSSGPTPVTSPNLSPAGSPSPSSSPSPEPASISHPNATPITILDPSPTFPCLTRLRLGCAHEMDLDLLADMIESRTGDRATQAGVQSLAIFELVFYDFVYSHGRGRQPWRKVCFDAFKERVLRYAREGGVDVEIKVERPYEPMYLSVP